MYIHEKYYGGKKIERNLRYLWQYHIGFNKTWVVIV